jgi:hypothetical protein
MFDREKTKNPYEKDELDRLGRNDKVVIQGEDGATFKVKWKKAKKHVNSGRWDVIEIA